MLCTMKLFFKVRSICVYMRKLHKLSIWKYAVDSRHIYSLHQTVGNTQTLVTLYLPREDQAVALIALVNTG